MKITLRFPTAAYAYAEVQVEGSNGAELEAKLADVQRAAGLAIQITGGGDSAGIAERLLKDELGAVRISEEQPGLSSGVPAATPPWEQGQAAPQAAPAAPWDAPQAAADPFASMSPPVPSSGPAPFGAAPQGEYYTLDIPSNLRDDWSPKGPDGKYLKDQGVMSMIQKTCPKDTVKWQADKKRWGIRRDVAQNIVDSLRQRGYNLT